MPQYLGVFAAMVMMVSGVAAHAEPIDYNSAKVRRCLTGSSPR